ncbi:MAG: UxaA family hydrolase [Planctomycetaceae bacterium]|nr:UxaA family hydrolase [Planctomycetaceae bacterium]
MKLALQVDDKDNVATIFATVAKGETVEVKNKAGGSRTLAVNDDIPYGHKIALVPIAPGSHIHKYGEVIGMATAAIAPGDYVHVHNFDSTRARGDIGKGA